MAEHFHTLQFVGLLGVALYIGAYSMLQLGMLEGDSACYPLVNMAAAGCVLLSLSTEFNLASALIQVSWITISLAGLARLILRRSEASSGEASSDGASSGGASSGGASSGAAASSGAISGPTISRNVIQTASVVRRRR